MKIFPVSFGESIKNKNSIDPFLYTAKDKSKSRKAYFHEHRYEYIGGILASIVAIIALLAFRGKK